MLKIAVCDDDKWIRKYLKTVIERELYAKTDLYSSGEELLAAREIYDILFMDICLADCENGKTKNGMETAREIYGRTGTLIIFITAMPDYVYEAYDVEAFHYLLKPIDEKKLCEVIHRAAEKADRRKASHSLLKKWKSWSRSWEKIFFVLTGGIWCICRRWRPMTARALP